MTRTKTEYRIEVKPGWMSFLLRELHLWEESRFTVETESGTPVILTTCKNVVDVATESFIRMPNNITITKVKGGQDADNKRSVSHHPVSKGARG